MANGKTVGQLREEARYHGPRGVRSADARRHADRALTSDKDYMDDAIADTRKVLREQSPVTKRANQAMSALARKKSLAKSKGFK